MHRQTDIHTHIDTCNKSLYHVSATACVFNKANLRQH